MKARGAGAATVVLVLCLATFAAGGQGATAASGASSPEPPSPTLGRAQRMAAEQAGVASAGRALGLGSGERLVVKDVITDADGTTHIRYNRTYNGLRVIGGDLVSHRDRFGRIKSVTWNGSHTVSVASTKPKASMASAYSAGTRKASRIQERSAPTNAGELVVYSGSSGGVSGKGTSAVAPKLAWDVTTDGVRADQSPSRLHTIVDANTGAAITSFDDIGRGTGNGIYSGQVTIGTTGAGTSWSMRDPAGNYTTDLGGRGNGTGIDLANDPGTTFADTDNIWGNGANTDRASAGVDAQYGAEKTFDYFKNVLGRNGIWNTGVGARSRVHYGNAYVNAFWDGTQMTYGDGAGNASPLTELDVAGHEMTHGVTENTAGLIGQGEAGGINEATSDIFGTAVEWYANNASDTPDYLLGERLNIGGQGPLRYMDRPSRDGASQNCWFPGVGNLDVHYSGGPLNHWFYLASEGSGAKVVSGVSYDSPTCNASTVSPIGRDKAEKIWYRTLTTYLTSGSDYAAARDGAIQSAKDLYGPASPECTGVASAFSAIAVPVGAVACGSTPAPPLGNNLLRNPGFESGNTLWSATPDVIGQWGSAPPVQPAHSGTWSAWLGGYGVANTTSISQLVTIPAGARLSYYVHVDTLEAAGLTVFDTMTVRAGATVLQSLSNRNAAAGYQLRTFDLSGYAGQTVKLSFTGVEDGSAATSFILDDLAITTPAALTRLNDLNRDGSTDLVARDAAGTLWLYPGNGVGGYAARRQIGAGWNIMNAIVTAGDVTGDGNADLCARDTAGRLWLYPGTGTGGLSARRLVSSGWGSYTITNAADLNGAGRPDLLARDAAGVLWLYPFSGNAVMGARARISGGWNGYTFRGPGDLSGDGRADILARDPAGSLWLYRGNGAGGLAARTLVGNGWAGMNALVTPGNWDRTGGNDTLARDSAGSLWLYPGNNAGGLGARRLIGGGWGAYTIS